MERNEWEAWEPEEPRSGFGERVVALALEEQAPTGRSRAGRVLAGLLVAAAFAAALAFGAIRQRQAARGDVAAEARREVHVGARAVAVLEPGAHVRWDGDAILQDRGDVFWRVEPGARFAVRTPAGEVAVKGTCFRVKVLAGAAAAGVAIAVVVYEGKVGVSRAGTHVDLAAGESAETDERGVHRTDEVPPAPAPRNDAGPAPTRDRAHADGMRQAIRALFEAGTWSATSPPSAPSLPATAPAVSAFSTMPTTIDDAGHPAVDRTYIQQRIHEDLFPLAKQCYASALDRKPRLGGRLDVYFRVLGDKRVGGVVDEVQILGDTTLEDAEMQTCVKESMMSVTFDAPPDDGELTVVYPIVFSPDDEPDSGRD
jgi:ferric-dicitrate binding protein FerR (iron transport regulator)